MARRNTNGEGKEAGEAGEEGGEIKIIRGGLILGLTCMVWRLSIYPTLMSRLHSSLQDNIKTLQKTKRGALDDLNSPTQGVAPTVVL